MICVAFGGGGLKVCEVSVLCGAGGGLTVHAAVTNTDNSTAAVCRLRGPVGTSFRVSTGVRTERPRTCGTNYGRRCSRSVSTCKSSFGSHRDSSTKTAKAAKTANNGEKSADSAGDKSAAK